MKRDCKFRCEDCGREYVYWEHCVFCHAGVKDLPPWPVIDVGFLTDSDQKLHSLYLSQVGKTPREGLEMNNRFRRTFK